ncbi:MAG: PhnD/SsuA/transferrin family substrate-binding protein [Chloroflexota bacterium]
MFQSLRSKKRTSTFILLLGIWLVALLAACNIRPAETPTPSLTAETTLFNTPTPTPAPLGSETNPIRIAFLEEGEPTGDAETARQEISQYLAETTGYNFDIAVFEDPADLINAFKEQEIHLGWLQPLTYIHAHDRGWVTVGLLINHFGTFYYGSQFLANVESGFISYFDPLANASTADAQTALSQLNGYRPCWVEPGSISGYILPSGILNQLNIETQPGVYSQTHPAVIRSLYIKGICDFGVTFSISGDPRTSSQVINDLPDAPQRVIILWQTNPDIPNLNLSYSTVVSESQIKQINSALMDFVETIDGKRRLTQALNDYDVQDLQIVDDSVYDPLRSAVRWSGIDILEWLGR